MSASSPAPLLLRDRTAFRISNVKGGGSLIVLGPARNQFGETAVPKELSAQDVSDAVMVAAEMSAALGANYEVHPLRATESTQQGAQRGTGAELGKKRKRSFKECFTLVDRFWSHAWFRDLTHGKKESAGLQETRNRAQSLFGSRWDHLQTMESIARSVGYEFVELPKEG